MKSYPVKENHNGSTVIEIGADRHPITYYKDKIVLPFQEYPNMPYQ